MKHLQTDQEFLLDLFQLPSPEFSRNYKFSPPISMVAETRQRVSVASIISDAMMVDPRSVGETESWIKKGNESNRKDKVWRQEKLAVSEQSQACTKTDQAKRTAVLYKNIFKKPSALKENVGKKCERIKRSNTEPAPNLKTTTFSRVSEELFSPSHDAARMLTILCTGKSMKGRGNSKRKSLKLSELAASEQKACFLSKLKSRALCKRNCIPQAKDNREKASLLLMLTAGDTKDSRSPCSHRRKRKKPKVSRSKSDSTSKRPTTSRSRGARATAKCRKDKGLTRKSTRGSNLAGKRKRKENEEGFMSPSARKNSRGSKLVQNLNSSKCAHSYREQPKQYSPSRQDEERAEKRTETKQIPMDNEELFKALCSLTES
eukprot:jgi/Bigna1/81921/fgenesh1_pg.85_\